MRPARRTGRSRCAPAKRTRTSTTPTQRSSCWWWRSSSGERAFDVGAHRGEAGGFQIEAHHVALADQSGDAPSGRRAHNPLQFAAHVLVINDHAHEALDAAGLEIAAAERRVGVFSD